VVEEVSRFVDNFVPVACGGCQRKFDTFFADLLGDASRSCADQTRCVTFCARLLQAIPNDGLQIFEKSNVGNTHVESSNTRANFLGSKKSFQVADIDLATVKYAGGQCTIDICNLEHVSKMLYFASAAGSN